MDTASVARLILLGAVWGSSFLFMRIAAPAFGPAPLIGVRLAVAAALLAVIAFATGRKLPWRKHWPHYLAIGVLNSAVPFFLFAYAAQTLPASILSLFNSLAPIFGAVVAAIWLRTAITAWTALGLLAGVAGVAVLSFDQWSGARLSGQGSVIALSFGAALAAPMLYGVAATYIKRHAVGGDAFGNAHGSMWAASLVAMPLAFAFAPAASPTGIHWGAAILLGLLCTGAAYLLQFRLIADLGPTRALTVAFLIPVFGVLWGVLFLHEPVSADLVLGGALIVLGMYLTTGAAPRAARLVAGNLDGQGRG